MIATDGSPEREAARLRLLLVEDSDGDALLLESQLAEAQTGSSLRPFVLSTRTRSLATARAAATQGEFDVILLDLGLPDAYRLEALTRMQEVAPQVPIVVLTGTEDDAVALEALRAGAQDYLVKGTATGELLLRALRYAAERKRTMDELARSRWLAGIGEMALAVQHEINNPLAALVLNAELLEDAEAPDLEAVQAVLTAARRVAEVTARMTSVKQPKVVEHRGRAGVLDLAPNSDVRVEGEKNDR